MRAAFSRTRSVSVRNATHYVSQHSFKDFKGFKGAYAVNELRVLLDKQYDDDADAALANFIDEFQKESMRYYNLKTLYIYAPYAIIDGSTIQKLLSTKTTLTALDLNIFAFHTPTENMWVPTSGITLKEVKVNFQDGIAYPAAGTDFFTGMENNNNISEIIIYNYSPHNPVVNLSHKLRGKVRYDLGVDIKYTSPEWWLF